MPVLAAPSDNGLMTHFLRKNLTICSDCLSRRSNSIGVNGLKTCFLRKNLMICMIIFLGDLILLVD